MSNSKATGAAAGAGSTGGSLGTLGFLFWLIVRFACPLGTTWGGISVHEAAYIVLLATVVAPIVLVLGLLMIAGLFMGIAAALK